MEVYPKLSETFISYELYELQKRNVDGLIISFDNPQEQIKHSVHDKVHYPVLYLYKINILSLPKIVMVNVFLLMTTPGKYLKTLLWAGINYGYLFFLKCTPGIVEIQRKGCSLIYANFSQHTTAFSQIAYKMMNIPYVFTVRGYDLFENPYKFELKSRDAKYIIVNAKFTKKYILNKFPLVYSNKIIIIPGGINTSYFRKTKKSHGNIFTISCVSRFVKKKGINYLIHACHRLKKQGILFHCYIGGYGPLESELITLCNSFNLNNEITFLGPLSHPKVLKILNNTDVFVLPSIISDSGDRDINPNILLEAMSCQNITVSTKVGGITEIIDDKINGFLVPPESVKALADKFIEIFNMDRETKITMGIKARKKIIKYFNITKSVSMIIKLLGDAYCSTQ
ncbi:MAG: hypothetical protein A2V66_11440 [Ignavibacteria bacterium RBG_13_36_8]|nr:MAG: hypothetical protein A2V66_11440 [Ignavibacteria bacterium RBG_13_36_8]